MIIEIKMVFFVLWALFTFGLIYRQMFHFQPPNRKWNWKLPQERLMVSIVASFIMMWVARAYEWMVVIVWIG